MINWVEEFDGAVTICDTNFKIIYMNQRSVNEFAKYGGADLLGQNLLDCHNPQSCEKIKEILQTGDANSYSKVKSDGRTKVIHQSCWRENGIIKGLVEISFYLEGGE